MSDAVVMALISLGGAVIGSGAITAIVNAAKDAAAAYDETAESQVKLAQVMRNTMGATAAEVQSIKDLARGSQCVVMHVVRQLLLQR